MKPELATRHEKLPGHHVRPQGHAMPPAPPAPSPRPAITWRQRLAFAGAALLFVGWLSWLGFLAFTEQTPIVLSRPQFLTSAVDVVVPLDRIESGPQQVKVERVLWSADAAGRKLATTTITVTNLDRCDGWTASDKYLLPLIPTDAGTWQVAPIPRSPGFEPGSRSRIYPFTPNTERQHQQMAKPTS